MRDGVAVSLAHTVDKAQAPDNPRPLGQQMTLDTAGHAMDLYTIWYHGSVITHIDSLCHYSFEGKIYNGFDRSKIADGPGCPKNGVEQQKDGIMTRGILVDLPRMRNVPYLEPGTPVYRRRISKRGRSSPTSRSAAATRCSCAPAAGRSAREKGPWNVARDAAGFHASVMPWLKQRDVALLGNDAVNDVQPSAVEGNAAPDSPARDRRAGTAAGGRDGSGSRGRGRGAAQALGVPADRGAGAGAGRHRVSAESDRDVLITQNHEGNSLLKHANSPFRSNGANAGAVPAPQQASRPSARDASDGGRYSVGDGDRPGSPCVTTLGFGLLARPRSYPRWRMSSARRRRGTAPSRGARAATSLLRGRTDGCGLSGDRGCDGF